MIPGSAAELAASIRSGESSAEQVVREHLATIAMVNPSLNAVVEWEAERALDEARRADQRRAAGDAPGPLDGVPVAVQDAIDVAGFHCTAGVPAARDRMPERDAPAIARLRAAGAIILAKTNLPELSEGYECDNRLFGRTQNPWHPGRTPGGSSGGAAALVAAGGAALGIGADSAGGLRVPAHWCGVAAIKPTSSRVPITGHFPPVRGPVSARMQFGAIARHVDDLALALPVLVRDDWRDASSITMPLGAPGEVSLEGLRVAWHAGNGIMQPGEATAEAVRRAAEALAREGAVVEEWLPPGIEATMDILPGLHHGADGGESLRAVLRELGDEGASPLLAKSLERALLAKARDALRFETLLADWKSFRHAMLHSLEARECIICPVSRDPAWPHGASLEEDPLPAMSPVLTWSLTGWPVVVVRAGSADGLPVGVQVVARPWREDVALAVARAVERALGPWPAPPAPSADL